MYNRKKLQKIARETLATARENLIRDGRLQPCGLVFTSAGMAHVFPVEFRDIQEKRVMQGAFRYLLRQVKAKAAVMVMESWVKMADDDTLLDLSRPVSDMPGRGEAIVIEARSRHGRVMIIQVFRKRHLTDTASTNPWSLRRHSSGQASGLMGCGSTRGTNRAARMVRKVHANPKGRENRHLVKPPQRLIHAYTIGGGRGPAANRKGCSLAVDNVYRASTIFGRFTGAVVVWAIACSKSPHLLPYSTVGSWIAVPCRLWQNLRRDGGGGYGDTIYALSVHVHG
jgi:hypothetical protein